MSESKQNLTRANNEYLLADDYAKKAGSLANAARELFPMWKDQAERKDNWERIMSTAPVGIFSIIFVFVCLVEYYFSREIYRDIYNGAPWVIALGFIAVAVFISEMVVYRFSAQKRRLKFYELRRNRNLDGETDEALQGMVNRLANRYFLTGLFFAVFMLAGLYYLSRERVLRELAAGLRTEGFNVQDWLPVILYAVEIIAGVYIWHLLKSFWHGWKVPRMKKSIDRHVSKCGALTVDAVSKFGNAEDAGYDAIAEPVSDDLHEAFFRNDQRDVNDAENYVQECHITESKACFKLLDGSQNGVKANISIITDYKFTASNASDGNGSVTMSLKSFEGDSVRVIGIEQPGQPVKTLKGAYALGTEEHTIYL